MKANRGIYKASMRDRGIYIAVDNAKAERWMKRCPDCDSPSINIGSMNDYSWFHKCKACKLEWSVYGLEGKYNVKFKRAVKAGRLFARPA